MIGSEGSGEVVGVGETDGKMLPVRLLTAPVGSVNTVVTSGMFGSEGGSTGNCGIVFGTPGMVGIGGTPCGSPGTFGRPGTIGRPGTFGAPAFGTDGSPGAPTGACNDWESRPPLALKEPSPA